MLQNIDHILDEQRLFFESQQTKPLEFRKAMLDKLSTAILAYEPRIAQALKSDLGKSDYEIITTEIGFTLSEIAGLKKNLPRYMKPQKRGFNLINAGAKAYSIHEPYGNCLIISPWNYPFQLAMAPVAGAIAAGNTILLKPSEISSHTAQVISELVHEYFDPEYFAVVQGGIEETSHILNQRFDHIFFTGSPGVGRIVMEKASKYLTPVILELGGKSPCIIDETANLKLAAKRIIFGKATNAGQTCIAPDYLLINNKIKDSFISMLKHELKTMYQGSPIDHPDYGRIINQRHFERLRGYLEDGEVLIGGHVDEESLQIDFTLLDVKDPTTAVMTEEIFGPILPIITYKSFDDILATIKLSPDPLALYVFSQDRSFQERVINRIPFGGGCINDTIMHVAHEKLPFGGRGTSGMGRYHGEFTFEAFSHHKSILKSPTFFDLKLKYPPYSDKNTPILKWLLYKR
jgi:aldehyde dehydrogenase (NAD+)